MSRSRRWTVTLLATAGSAYALDAIAVTAGVLLAASPLLDELPHLVVLFFLLSTYVTWAIGLAASLRANWTLLEVTGTSTNAMSKAAYDLTSRRTSRRRARQISSAVGYVSTEVAKEVPYYAGAFGAALVTDSVSANDALIFLGGANLGAAVYEYGLARLTRGFLVIRSRRADRVGRVSIPSAASK